MTFDAASTEPAAPTPAAAAPRARLGVGGGIAIAIAVLANVGFILLLVLIAMNQQRIGDQFSVWRFEPSAAIEAHVERTTMTEEGKFLFYASHPAIVPEEDFDATCSSSEDGTGILGCYLLADRTIHLYDVTDERLDGAEEVTAAHEMLHAAWDRMTPADRTRIEDLVEAEVAKRADDANLTERLAYYAKAEPGQRANELHSIVGTEFADISPELEAHYALYFVRRSAVVELNETSQVVIKEQIAQGEAIVAQMEELEAGVDADYAAYNAGFDQLNLDIDSFNYRADTGDFSSQAQFDAERQALLDRTAQLDALYASIDARITQYNDLGAQLDELSAVIDDLNAHLNIDPPRTTDE